MRAHEQAVVLQAASLLLTYPDERTRAAYPAVRDAAGAVCDRAARDALLRAVDGISALAEPGGLDLQRHYVQTMDQRRRCCLYLSWWTEGETRRRGLALARLKEVYRSRGHKLVSTELPDFLPVVLEFAASHPDLGLAVLQEHRAGLEMLRLALVEAATPYAGAVEAVCSLLPGPSPTDEAAARALASNGPPRENVGLEGYGFGPDASPESDLGPTSLLPTGARR
jgi:nitrate reductase delta subunit